MWVLLSSTKKSSQGSRTPNTARSSIRVPRSDRSHPCLATSIRHAYTLSHPRFYSTQAQDTSKHNQSRIKPKKSGLKEKTDEMNDE